MSTPDKITFKNRLRQWGIAIIEQRIANAQAAADAAQQAANQEEKSSAGDKYETGRAMGHLQKDMHASQLAAHLKDLATLKAVNTEKVYSRPVSGALIDCGDCAFFIAAGLGKQQVEGQSIFFISPFAPLAKTLEEKKAGDAFIFNKQTLTIKEIY
ncbi:MAG: hypothetical protein JST39_16755 [Bacteroidetes bacterium]|nr:hypothetical protein [Bacteroidota bacterium]